MLLKSFADFPRFNHVFPSSEKSESGLGGFPFILRNSLSTIFTPGNLQLAVSFEMRNSMAEHRVYFCWKHGRTWFPDWQGSYVMYGKQNKPNFFLRHLWKSESWAGRIRWNSNTNKMMIEKRKRLKLKYLLEHFRKMTGSFLQVRLTDGSQWDTWQLEVSFKMAKTPGVLSYICHRGYLPPQRVQFLRRFGLKTGIGFAHFGLELSIVFEGTAGAYGHIDPFNFKWLRKN